MDTSPDTCADQTSPSVSLTGIDLEALLKEVMKSEELGTMKSRSSQPYVEILEQPKPKVRFRYECEGRSAGSIMGKESTNDAKTYPTIRIRNYKGIAHVVVSCVTVDNPFKPHPHKLVGKEHCKNGIFAATFSHENNDDMRYPFTNLGIQCMKKKDIQASLDERKKCNVNPFDTGFDHKGGNINLNAVRLCFQVFLPLEQTQSSGSVIKLPPVVSDPIFDAKSNADLAIVRLSHTSASIAGGMEMILLCDKVNKDDIRVKFFEEKDGVTVWEDYGEFNEKDVHKQYAIVFKTPTYMRGVDNLVNIIDPIDVQIQLVNQKATKFSEPVDFKLTPIIMNSEEDIKAKRPKPDPEYYRDLGNNRDPERRRKTPNRSGQGKVGTPEVKVEAPEGHYQFSPAGPSNVSVSPYHQHSRTPSPSYNASYQAPPVYAQPFSPEHRPNVFGEHQSNIYIPAPGGTPHGPDLYPPISPHNNPVFVPNPHPPDREGESSFAELVRMDTTRGNSLNNIDTTDLLPSLSQNLSDIHIQSQNLNISLSNQNMSDSLTKIANDALEKFQQS
ncbi:hypothetical protein WDU94_014163 [Cyamophila willieti]